MGTDEYTRRTASISGQYIRICHPRFDPVRKQLTDIPTVTYDGKSCWEIPLEVRYVEKLKTLDFIFSNGLTKWLEQHRNEQMEKKEITIHSIPQLGGTLYGYQLEGVNFIEKQNGRALIADEMGLGKTVQALAWIQLHKEEVLPVIVVCPSSLKINWERETHRWTTDLNVEILNGQTPYTPEGDFLIINYDILPYWEKTLKMLYPATVIIDEAHYTKNNKAKRTKSFKRLVKGVKNVIALTGTPIENRPIEIFNIVQAIDPTVFPNYISFVMDFCDAKRDRFGWDVSGASNTLVLNRILKESIMIRRKKKDVLKDLPPKQMSKITLSISNHSEYKKAENEFVQYLKDRFMSISAYDLDENVERELKQYAKDHEIEVEDELTDDDLEKIKREKIESAGRAPMFAKIETLKQLAVQGKMKQIIEWIEDFLESDEKLVVFANHRKVIDTLMKHFKGAVKIDGSVSMKKRQDVVDSFQNNPNVRLLIGNIKAAGIGITLTAASNVAVIQFPWSPGILMQACDRVHRISQTKQVTIWNLVGEDTIEEKIIDLLIKKEKLIGEVLDGKITEDNSILSELINDYRRK